MITVLFLFILCGWAELIWNIWQAVHWSVALAITIMVLELFYLHAYLAQLKAGKHET